MTKYGMRLRIENFFRRRAGEKPRIPEEDAYAPLAREDRLWEYAEITRRPPTSSRTAHVVRFEHMLTGPQRKKRD